MFRPRIIPLLLLKNNGLVKSVHFRNARYIGDPINAVKIFNDLKADELIFLDITATPENRCISPSLVKKIGDEAFMPFAVGGGIRNIQDAHELINNGAEKIVLNSSIINNLSLLRELSNAFGTQSIIASVDINKDIWKRYTIHYNQGRTKSKYKVEAYLKILEENGAGEILINTIYRDGTMQGYDLDLISLASSSVKIPIIACGGAGSLIDFRNAVNLAGAMAVAAGSMFVFHGLRKAVLINYPSNQELMQLFK